MTSTPPARNEKRWQATSFAAFAEMVRPPADHGSRPWIVAVDGRSAAGKTTLARRLASGPTCALVHTDDLAWHEPLFAWGHLLRDGVLIPARRGRPVTFVPPAWPDHGREGAIVVSDGVDLLIVEGVGASQRLVADVIDVATWVEADRAVARHRGIARDIASGVNGTEAETIAFWDEWDAAEVAFLEADRPWERADLIVCGTPDVQLGPDDVLVSRS